KHFAGRTDIHLIHITGEKHYEDVMRLCKKIGLKSDNVAIHPYVYEMPKFMGACDLVVCRAGAITLAEVTAMGLPAVLIPSPYVTNNHQEYNAKVLEKNGAAVVLLEKDLTASKMIELIHFFMKDRSKLADMRLKSKELAKTNATDLIYEELLKLMKE
ncbi:MAG TPA: undecaprenyldiphospho-muramoylpentapeptide beta-N-acetylglucosaminyltransferase, partial [Clostridiales bacterium]|nr:undecaprenyldiphospho-muramoylpentapeptide beta-N-acetylglucosaminyltransferase [Clostridiales bacterium]